MNGRIPDHMSDNTIEYATPFTPARANLKPQDITLGFAGQGTATNDEYPENHDRHVQSHQTRPEPK